MNLTSGSRHLALYSLAECLPGDAQVVLDLKAEPELR